MRGVWQSSRAKRCFDLVFAATTLILIAPILLIIAVAVKITSRGSVLIRHKRVGKDGAAIYLYKFRTMYAGSEEEPTRFARVARDDPRITKIGAFLSRTSLSDLPQFLNVLRGDISIIGPKPLFAYELRHISLDQRPRLDLRPGITGYWQVFGRRTGEYTFDAMLDMDLTYVREQSFRLDMKILYASIIVGFTAANPY